jgi:hypothetical protein
LAPFDFASCPKSKLEKNIRHLLEEISNFSMYERAMQHIGVNYEAMPIQEVSREVLIQAQDMLGEIGEAIEQDQEICKKGVGADLDEL